MKIKTSALVGIGYWGKVHLKYLQSMKKVFIKKVFYRKNTSNLNNSKLKKEALTNKMKLILNDTSINYVDIVTPVQSHAPLVIKFLKKNKFVLVEKPLIMGEKQEKEITKLVKKNKKKLLVSYPYQFSKTLNFAKKMINNNNLGKLKYIEIYLQQCGRFMKYDVNYLLAPHAITIFSMFFKLENVDFKLHKIIENQEKCETSFLTCQKKNKIVGQINLSLNYANNKNKKIINLYCQKGTIICDLNDKKNTLTSFKYSRISNRNYKIAKIKIFLNKKFDEKNNMKYVLDNFFSNKFDYSNFLLTKKINNFIKRIKKH